MPASRAPRYPIRAVSRLTGLGIDTLRAWERRYAAVTPERDDRGRWYTEADVERLRLLSAAVAAGHRVGQIASLHTPALRRLLRTHEASQAARPAPDASPSADGGAARPLTGADPRPSHAGVNLAALHTALATLDTAALDQEFSRLASVLPADTLVRDVLLPSLRAVGDSWHRRRAGIAQEHVLSATLRHLLGSFLRLHARRAHPTRLLFATLAGDRHEIGILAAAMLAASRGLGVSYVGADLPARDLAHAVRLAGAQVLVLGLTLDAEATTSRELRALLKHLPGAVEVWAGGRAAAAQARTLAPRGLVLHDFDTLLAQLDRCAARVADVSSLPV